MEFDTVRSFISQTTYYGIILVGYHDGVGVYVDRLRKMDHLLRYLPIHSDHHLYQKVAVATFQFHQKEAI